MTRSALKIESGIPIPQMRRDKFDPTYDAMKPGQSVFFTDEKPADSFYMAMRHHFKTKGKPFAAVIRKMDHGWRVWKVKAE